MELLKQVTLMYMAKLLTESRENLSQLQHGSLSRSGSSTGNGIKYLVLLAVGLGMAIPLRSDGGVILLHGLFLFAAPAWASIVLRTRPLTWIWAGAIIWFVGQTLTDLNVGNSLMSLPATIGLNIALVVSGLYWCWQKFELRLCEIVLASATGTIILELVVGHALGTENPWKYGFAPPTIVAVVALLYCLRASPALVSTALVVAAAVSLYFDSRFNTGLSLLTAIAVLGARKATHGRRKLAQLSVIALLILIYALYPAVASSGLMGERAYQQQSDVDVQNANYVLAARLEFPQMAYLSAQNLPIGIGSYSELSSTSSLEALDFVSNNVLVLNDNQINYLTVQNGVYVGYNAHSLVLSTFLFAGLAALPFWLAYVLTVFKGMVAAVVRSGQYVALVIFCGCLTVWDLAFSPLSNRTYIFLALTLLLGLGASRTRRRKHVSR